MIKPGDRVPHFEVAGVDGRPVRYATIWQRKSLVLLCLPPDAASRADDYATRLIAGAAAFSADTACVVTRDPVAHVDAPAVVVADQWGEVVHVAAAPSVDGLPDPEDVLDWIRFLRIRCPECEGEAR